MATFANQELLESRIDSPCDVTAAARAPATLRASNAAPLSASASSASNRGRTLAESRVHSNSGGRKAAGRPGLRIQVNKSALLGVECVFSVAARVQETLRDVQFGGLPVAYEARV